MHQEFLNFLQYEKRYSPHTVKSYRSDILQLLEYLDAIYPGTAIVDVNRDILRSWIVQMMEENLSARSVNRKLSAVKSFFKWARKFRGVEVDPTVNLSLPKIAKRLPVFVEEEQMDSLQTEGYFPNSFEGFRDRIMIELFYQTGIRSAELISLKTVNIDFQRATIKVLGKRNKERIIPVGKDVIQLMQPYHHMRQTEFEPGAEFFITSKGKPLYPKLVYKVVNSYLGRVSSLRKKSPHVLRHTFATHMLNRGADLNAIKELLGHASLAATQVYTHNSIDKLKEIHQRAHPTEIKEKENQEEDKLKEIHRKAHPNG